MNGYEKKYPRPECLYEFGIDERLWVLLLLYGTVEQVLLVYTKLAQFCPTSYLHESIKPLYCMFEREAV